MNEAIIELRATHETMTTVIKLADSCVDADAERALKLLASEVKTLAFHVVRLIERVEGKS